VRTWSVTRF